MLKAIKHANILFYVPNTYYVPLHLAEPNILCKVLTLHVTTIYYRTTKEDVGKIKHLHYLQEQWLHSVCLHDL